MAVLNSPTGPIDDRDWPATDLEARYLDVVGALAELTTAVAAVRATQMRLEHIRGIRPRDPLALALIMRLNQQAARFRQMAGILNYEIGVIEELRATLAQDTRINGG